MANQETKVVTGEVRFSYLKVWKPERVGDDGDPKYSVCLLIPKSDTATLKAINRAIEAAKHGYVERFGGTLPAVLKTPLRDGDKERGDDPVYAGHYFINANAKTQPGLVYKNGQTIIDSTDLYSGCYGRASVTFYPFKVKVNAGIACGLNNLMKTRDGESLGGRSRAEDDFAGYFEDDGDDDFLG